MPMLGSHNVGHIIKDRTLRSLSKGLKIPRDVTIQQQSTTFVELKLG